MAHPVGVEDGDRALLQLAVGAGEAFRSIRLGRRDCTHELLWLHLSSPNIK